MIKNKCCDKLEGFADDGTVMAKATPEAFLTIRSILDDFENLSGLRCNTNKSALLPIGYDNGEIPAFFHNAGFPVTDKLTILGVEITNNTIDLPNNF
jgi:hypothetical protein